MTIFCLSLKTIFTKLNMLITLKIRKIKSNGSIFTTPEVIIHLNIWLKSKISKKKILGLREKISTKLEKTQKNFKNPKFF